MHLVLLPQLSYNNYSQPSARLEVKWQVKNYCELNPYLLTSQNEAHKLITVLSDIYANITFKFIFDEHQLKT